MLGKLIKYEWKSTCKVGGLMALLTVIVTFFGWLSFRSPMWQQLGNDAYYRFSLLDLLSIVTLFMWVFMLVGITYGMLIYLGVHFYRTMYTDQGYLTHTLPVGKHQLLGSKILVSGIWVMIVYLLVILSAVLVTGSLVGIAIPDGYGLKDIWNEVRPVLKQMVSEMEKATGMKLSGYVVCMVISLLVGPFLTVTVIFGAITVGQLFTKVRVLMAIVCYIGVSIISGLISSLVQGIISCNTTQVSTYMNGTIISNSVVSLIIAVALYAISYQIITKKLNME